MLSHCLCAQDISARAWRWRAGPGSWSGRCESHQGPQLSLLGEPLWAGGQKQLSVFLQSHHVWDGRGQLTKRKAPVSAASRDRQKPNSSLLLLVSQMVIPADPEEMKQFQEQCVAQCQCAVDISLPLAYILLPSKQAFQSIYNRCGCRAGANIATILLLSCY